MTKTKTLHTKLDFKSLKVIRDEMTRCNIHGDFTCNKNILHETISQANVHTDAACSSV